MLVIALLGGPLLATAWRELRRGRLSIEALFLLTMTGAMAASLQAHITGQGKIYFEVVSVLLVVYTLGKVIGARSRAAALASSRAWAGQLETCRLVDARGRTRVVPVTEVLPGDLVEVNPGETIAVDGVIRDGIGFVSEASVSGEPFAVVRRPGDRVLAGSASHDATFRIEATANGTERQVDRLLAAVEAARDRPISLQAHADRVGRRFFPLVVLTALGTFGYWTREVYWEVGLFNAMSVLLVACPCAIGLATPIVVWSALARLAERGLIVRSGDAIERLAEVDRVMLDKTGTLTDESFTLLDIATTATGEERAKLLGWLSLIEERSAHPIAKAFAKLPKPPDAATRVLSLRAVPGCGVEAEIEERGERHVIQIGTLCWISSLVGRDPKGSAEAQALPFESRLTEALKTIGNTIYVAQCGNLVAVAVFAERLRDSARAAISEIQALGLPIDVLTGDAAGRAEALDLPPARAGMLPDDKRAAVAGGQSLFIGDGLNDAAALASARGSRAGGRADITVSAADATLYHGDLRVLPWAIELCREAVCSVRRSMYRALGYNLIGVALAACGILHPVVAAVLMVVSSLSLVFFATRLGVYRNHCESENPLTLPEPIETASRERQIPEEAYLRSLTLPARRAFWHALAFALQGVAFLLLLDTARALPSAGILFAAFALFGFVLAYAWLRWATIPHALDMCFGMLTFGNLGMLLGWWATTVSRQLRTAAVPVHQAMRESLSTVDVGRDAGIRERRDALARTPFGRQDIRHVAAMFTGGNIGMVLGMLAGGICAAQYRTDTMTLAVSISFL